MTQKHIWIKSFTIDEEGNFTNESIIILSPSLETLRLELTPTEDIKINDSLIKVSFTNKKARIKYYQNPISFDGKEYLMYKRSASSSRQGNVLFIRSDLFDEMDEWSNCGLDLESFNKDKISKNFLAFEAYRALTLSGCDSFIRLEPKNVLVIDDLYSTFTHEALVVTDKEPESAMYGFLPINGKIFAYEKNDQEIKNCIWDGQGFLDSSVFREPEFVNPEYRNNYRNKSMMIIRNRFFKSCVFRTKLKDWFAFKGLIGEIERDEHGIPIYFCRHTMFISFNLTY